MPVYRLTPLQGTERRPQWRASSIRPHCLWIVASDEDEARSAVAKATACSDAQTPWQDAELVSCERDNNKDLAAGIIWVRRKPPVAVVRASPA
ncbi:MAG: hypothetical protein KGJ78_09045 [Alphaproteobacteria bacterium]|nr:hypothetical protein [Alphaproteobacteria bacterium]